jgi:adenylosuccinate lyase
MLSNPVDPTTLTALSPLDGRYASKAAPLREYLSEYALIRYRTLVEVRWLQHLANEPAIPELDVLDRPVNDILNQLVDQFGIDDARRVKKIEATTNHDVKAVEYYLREKLAGIENASAALAPFIHFACTSEDINNLAYALMLRDARQDVLVPAMKKLINDLRLLAHKFSDLAMLARTHGQPASPTTLGKEIANFVARLERQQESFSGVPVYGKINGAVGNFNAHVAAYPDADWRGISERFLESLRLSPAAYTTQIEPHDWIAEYAQTLTRFNTVLLDLCQDFWGYVSLGYFRSRAVAGEVGSSTMPHKVNPIEFENAEGNLGVSNALLIFLANKLPQSRFQRDLTDSTVLRNFGVALGHSLISIESANRGVGKLEADTTKISADLDACPEVLGEAVQTRGQAISAANLQTFIHGLEIPSEARQRLLGLRPSDYIGLAAKLAQKI